MSAPNRRSRLVGRELKKDERIELHVATHPLEATKALPAKCAMCKQFAKPLRIGIVDANRAYFYAEARLH